MGDPLIEEFCRIYSADSMRSEFFRRCQREFRDRVQPQLDERERLLVENAELKAQIEQLTAPKTRKRTEPVEVVS